MVFLGYLFEKLSDPIFIVCFFVFLYISLQYISEFADMLFKDQTKNKEG